jgi:hypothetical protein
MVYDGFLQWAGVTRPFLDPDKSSIHFFRSTTREGEELFTIVNRDDSLPLQEIRFKSRASAIRVDVAQRMAGAVAITAKGDVQR